MLLSTSQSSPMPSLPFRINPVSFFCSSIRTFLCQFLLIFFVKECIHYCRYFLYTNSTSLSIGLSRMSFSKFLPSGMVQCSKSAHSLEKHRHYCDSQNGRYQGPQEIQAHQLTLYVVQAFHELNWANRWQPDSTKNKTVGLVLKRLLTLPWIKSML